MAQHGIIVAALGACNASSSKAEAMVHTGQYLLSTMYHAALNSEASSSSICPSYLSPQETPTILFASRHHVAIGNQGSTANVGHGHAVPSSKERIIKSDSRRKEEVAPVSVSPLSKTGQMLNLILRTPDQVSHPNNRMLSTYLRHTRYVFQDLVSHGVIISIFIICPRIPASAS